jgi:hypothetical protein
MFRQIIGIIYYKLETDPIIQFSEIGKTDFIQD